MRARREVLAQRFPQAQFHYVLHDGETSVARNDIDRLPLLEAVERMEQVFTGPLNPEKEIELGLFAHAAGRIGGAPRAGDVMFNAGQHRRPAGDRHHLQPGGFQVMQRLQGIGRDRAFGGQRVVDVAENADQPAPVGQRPCAQGPHDQPADCNASPACSRSGWKWIFGNRSCASRTSYGEVHR